MRELWLGSTENAPKKLVELINMPSLNIRGMAQLAHRRRRIERDPQHGHRDHRYAPGKGRWITTRPRRRLIEHIRKHGYFIVDHEPSPEERMSHRESRESDRARRRLQRRPHVDGSADFAGNHPHRRKRARPTVLMPTSGGSDPADVIERALGTRTIAIPTANHDDNQHTFNENLRIQNLWDGIELMAALLTM